jgi:hypothetical protein
MPSSPEPARAQPRANPCCHRVLRRGEVASAITTGASRPDQVHANAQASGVELTADVLAAVDAALGDAPVKAPTLAPFAQEGVLDRSGFSSALANRLSGNLGRG